MQNLLNKIYWCLILMAICVSSCSRMTPKQFQKAQLKAMNVSIENAMEYSGFNNCCYDFFLKGMNELYPILIHGEKNDTLLYKYITKNIAIYSFHFNYGWAKDNKPLEVDSLGCLKFLLQNMYVGGRTSWTYPTRVLEHYGKNELKGNRPLRRDLVTYYYLYYGLFGAEQNPKQVYDLHLVDTTGEVSHCFPLDTMLVGNPDKLYKKLPPSKDNEMLYQLHQCYKKWVSRIEKVGWNQAKKMKLSPFDNCLCKIALIPPEK